MASISFLLRKYPEFFVSSVAFFFFLILRFALRRRRRSLIPTNWPLMGMMPALAVNIPNIHEWVTEVLAACGSNFNFYGPCLSSMDMFITADPANVRHVFNIGFANYPKGPEFAEIFDVLGDGIFTADDNSWRAQRRAAQALMAAPAFRSFVGDYTREKVESHLVPLLESAAEKGEVLDLQDVFLRLTFDITCRLVLGVDPGCLTPGFPAVPFATAMDDAMQTIFLRHVVPPLWWKTMRRVGLGQEKKMALAWRAINEFIAHIIKTKRELIQHEKIEDSSAHDFLSSYIINPPEGMNEHTSDDFLRDTAVNFMLAGRDTTGAALAWFFWLLILNPAAEQKIIDELESTRDHTDLIYLQAALCEALRLYPPVPFEHKTAMHSETLPSGHDVHPRKKIVIPTFSMGRMVGVWGKDCAAFKPERWITEQGKLKHEPSYKFLSFNSGPRTCLGKEVAFTQIKTVAAALVPRFKFQVVEGHIVEPKLSIVLHMKNGLMVKLSRRMMLNGC